MKPTGGGSLFFPGGVSCGSATGKISGREEPKLGVLLLLGPTGSGKTPLGDWLEQTSPGGRRCHHFDFGANLRAVVAGKTAAAFTAEEIRFLRRVLEEGALLEDEQFPLAARILDAFVARRKVQPADRLILNGLPRHLDQAKALERKLTVTGVIHLDCDAPTVAERLRRNAGGDRVQRTDDTDALVARKLAIFRERTQPLLDYYQQRAVPVLGLAVNVESQPPELARKIEMWLKAENKS